MTDEERENQKVQAKATHAYDQFRAILVDAFQSPEFDAVLELICKPTKPPQLNADRWRIICTMAMLGWSHLTLTELARDEDDDDWQILNP